MCLSNAKVTTIREHRTTFQNQSFSNSWFPPINWMPQYHIIMFKLMICGLTVQVQFHSYSCSCAEYNSNLSFQTSLKEFPTIIYTSKAEKFRICPFFFSAAETQCIVLRPINGRHWTILLVFFIQYHAPEEIIIL